MTESEYFRCIVRDIGVGGARVALEGAVSLPSDVTLRFDYSGVAKIARVAWQNDLEAGLAFVDDEKFPTNRPGSTS